MKTTSRFSAFYSLFLLGSSLSAAPVEELSFLELRERPLSDLAAQRRLVELGDAVTIQICLEQLFTTDVELSESAVLVLAGSKQDMLLPMFLSWLERYTAGEIWVEDARASEPMARIAVQLLKRHAKASPILRASAERLARRDRGTQLRLLCAWLRNNSTAIKWGTLPENAVGLE